jgi:hypothetical protein
MVSSINAGIDRIHKETGIKCLKKINYQQMVFIDKYLSTGDPERAALVANTRIKSKSVARNWGMRQLENSLVQSTIRKALEGENRLAPDKIAKKVADVFDEAVTVNDVVKVAEFVAKTRGEYNDGNKTQLNIGVGVIGGQSTEELEKQFAILVGEGNVIEGGEESRESSLLDEIVLRDGSETGTPEL